ncbi:hypothetical protein [Streptomyces europaeiscabiei]|uniref:hypothetical protein n=1 Tax=Streptomyces europaeiscabiei TaxID=146819 RepID=UPI002E2B2791|nr:hypothetical protein [Streptomyces europaeiscabiei]
MARIVSLAPHQVEGLGLEVLTAEYPTRRETWTSSPHTCGEAGPGALADLGFVGLDGDPDNHPVITTGRRAIRNPPLTAAEKEANRLLDRERAAVEHGFAHT